MNEMKTAWKILDPFTIYRNCCHFTELMRGRTSDFEASLLESIKRGTYDKEIQEWWDTLNDKQIGYVLAYEMEDIDVKTRALKNHKNKINELARQIWGSQWKP